MTNKTWFDLWPVILIFGLIPIVLVFLPTFELKGTYYGGGVICDTLINIYLPHSPYKSGDIIIDLINNGSPIWHRLFALIIAINLSLVFIWLAYIICEFYMLIANYYSNKSFESKRKSIRR